MSQYAAIKTARLRVLADRILYRHRESRLNITKQRARGKRPIHRFRPGGDDRLSRWLLVHENKHSDAAGELHPHPFLERRRAPGAPSQGRLVFLLREYDEANAAIEKFRLSAVVFCQSPEVVADLIAAERPDIICLQETRLQVGMPTAQTK
jgi:hypothetical protein